MVCRKMSGVPTSTAVNDHLMVHTTDCVAMIDTCWHGAFISEDRGNSNVAVTIARALGEIALPA